MIVGDICSRNVVCIARDASLVEAARAMRELHVGALVVIEREDGPRVPVGILTDRDIALEVVAQDASPSALRVEDVMSAPAASCLASRSIFDAVLLMREHAVRRLPVVDRMGILAGIVTADDVHEALQRHSRELMQALARSGRREMHRRAG